MTSNWTWSRSSNIGNAPNDPHTELEHGEKYSIYSKYLHMYPEAQILVRFALRLAVSEILGHQKLEMHQMTPKWTYTLHRQKYFIYNGH